MTAPSSPSLASIDSRTADVQVLSVSGAVELSELSTGTLLLRLSGDGVAVRGPFAAIDLRVDHSFVSAKVPLVLGVEALRAALQERLPDGYLLLASHGGGAVILTVLRTETPRVPDVFCTSRDATLRVRRLAANRLALRGCAHGASTLVLRVDTQAFKLSLAPGERPVDVAERVREALGAEWSVMLGLPTEGDGPVDVTVLPRR
ncbi:MAG: hypothetical protein AB1938_05190 [Myxococcota bacterium]